MTCLVNGIYNYQLPLSWSKLTRVKHGRNFEFLLFFSVLSMFLELPLPCDSHGCCKNDVHQFSLNIQIGSNWRIFRNLCVFYFVSFKGFEKPSAIQQRGIVPFCKGLDVIQQAQSGTGKTATFCSGVLQQLDFAVVECQALVLAPTRELAQQIEKVMRALGDYLGVKVHACVGGTSVREDQRILSAGVHVVVGTPGRVFDMLRRQSLRSDYIKMFVLDEADEMLSRGFKDQVFAFPWSINSLFCRCCCI